MRLWVTVVLAAASLVGCGEDPRTLTRDDVSGIPAGDAVGAQFSGEYLIASNKIQACHCRVGNCATLFGLTGIPLEMLQTDGVLQMSVATTIAQGGVSGDGGYTLGFAQEDLDHTEYTLIQGRFNLSGGAPISTTLTWETTVHGSLNDCDIRTDVLASHVGPLARAAEATRAAGTSSGARGAALGLVGVAADAHR